MVQDAGHSSREPGISKLLVEVRRTVGRASEITLICFAGNREVFEPLRAIATVRFMRLGTTSDEMARQQRTTVRIHHGRLNS